MRALLTLPPRLLPQRHSPSAHPWSAKSPDIVSGRLWLTVLVDIPGGYENEPVGIRTFRWMSACPHVRMSAACNKNLAGMVTNKSESVRR